MKPNDFITIGVIIAPHGVRGDLRIMPRTDFPERFMHMDACYIDGKEYHVASARFHKQFVLASFKEIPDRNAAELFAKKEIQVRREDLVELPEGRYYIFDIIGLEVQDTKGNVLGTVTDVLLPVLMMSMWFPKMENQINYLQPLKRSLKTSMWRIN